MEIFKLIPPQDPRVLTAIAPFSDDMLKDTDIKDRKDLSDKMFKTMNKYSGLGLSANQCGLPFRMFVMGDNLLLENREKLTGLESCRATGHDARRRTFSKRKYAD